MSVKAAYSIGVDFGTNSVRALVVDVRDGRELGASVLNYPSGKDGILLDAKDPNLARQNPADYIRGFYASVAGAVKRARKVRGFDPKSVIGIGIDTTGSTPIPVDKSGTPLALDPRFKKDLAAQAWLWKDHTAHEEAAMITQKARELNAPYLGKCGGAYSSEWFWSKIFHCLRSSPKVFAAAWSWVECADFVPAFVTGNTDPRFMPRSVCAAGHKAMYNDEWGGLPSKEFLAALSPALAELRDRLYDKAVPSDCVAGPLTPQSARKTGLPAGIPVAVGAFDAHMGAVGAGIKPGTLVKIIGTSTCDMMVSPMSEPLADIPGVCGIAPGSIIPGMYGIEAGQSAVGDIFNWFVTRLCPPEFRKGDPHAALSRAAAKLRPAESGLLALDWNNGNRTVLVDPLLTGLLMGQTLHTTAPEIYRALIEATAFGALAIIRRIEEYGVKVKEVMNCGGIAEKNPLLMQIYADVIGRPMKVSGQAQTCALGAAVFGAVVGGAYKTTEQAQRAMTMKSATVYQPDRKSAAVYAQLYPLYLALHDAFGTTSGQRQLHRVMKDLIAIRDRVRSEHG
jgi:L-ribulokinase